MVYISPQNYEEEDDVWKTSPSNNDLYAGWAKRSIRALFKCSKDPIQKF